MPIVVNLDVMMARRKIRSNELARAIGITETNLSLLKSGKVKGVRFATLEAICDFLDCQPGDLLEFRSAVEVRPPRPAGPLHSPPRATHGRRTRDPVTLEQD